MTSDTHFPVPPPLPDPQVALQWTQWLGQIRGVLILLGGMGLGGTWLKKFTDLSDAELSGYAAGAVTVISLAAWIGPSVWSWIEKKRTAWAVAKALRQAEVAAAVASAHRGLPVTVVVTPAGQPNIAVPVSFSEQVMAASVPPSPAGTTTADLNRDELARHQGRNP